MAVTCAACRSDQVQTEADRYRCLVCGAYTDFYGNVAAGGPVWTSPVPAGQVKNSEVTLAQVDATATPEPVAVKASAQKPKKKAKT